jgi:hypothetical protein
LQLDAGAHRQVSYARAAAEEPAGPIRQLGPERKSEIDVTRVDGDVQKMVARALV